MFEVAPVLAEKGSMAGKHLVLRRADRCVACATALPAGTSAVWDSTTRTVTCESCTSTPSSAAPVAPGTAGDTPAAEPVPGAQLYRGKAGDSLNREYERRRAAREKRARERHPRIGGLLLALNGEPQHQVAFRQGAHGEQTVAEYLERHTADSYAVILHNRRMPSGCGDIDHIAIAPAGVLVIDTKNLAGPVKVHRPWFGQPRLLIAGRDRTTYLDGLDRQIQAVRQALAASQHDDVPIQGVLCFPRADLPLIGTLEVRQHLILYPKGLAKRIRAPGPQDVMAVAANASRLAGALKPA